MKVRVPEPAEGTELYRHSMRLQEILELDGSPVAVAIIPEPPEGIGRFRHKATACVMVQIARRGDRVYATGRDILCGGRANLGIGNPPMWKLDDFLVRKEKLFKSREAARRLLSEVKKRAPKQGGHLVFSPLEKASFTPDVVLFIGIPALISRIIFLNAFDNGGIEALHSEPLCSGAIATPITTGKIGLSFLDRACRLFGRYKPEEMIIGVPYPRLSRIIDSIDLSSAGTAKPDFVLKLAEFVLRRHVPSRPE